MKSIFTILFLAFAVSFTNAQTFSIQHDGLTRTYRLYVPPSYSSTVPSPLVLNFHGYGSTASEQQFYTLMDNVALQENFIIAYPNGVNNAWNSGAITESPADDVSFTAALIDSVAAAYSIDTDRVYSTGMSNGGFMSFRLACELEDKIAAIASVTGMMANEIIPTCQSNRPVPTMLIHGNADAVVNYNGLNGYYVGAEASVDYWVQKNNCTTTPVATNIPDIDMTDQCTATLYYYGDGDNGSEVEFYRIDGGDHTWPDAAVDIAVTNHDFNASETIWEFFSRHSLNGPISSNEIISEETSITITPNPCFNNINISTEDTEQYDLYLYDMTGRIILTQNKVSNMVNVSTASIPSGVYLLTLRNENDNFSQKLIKQ